jgi:hypothetical protein
MDDANDTATDDAPTEAEANDSLRAHAIAALTRVLDHAEGHGEAYAGATDDHRTLRELLEAVRGDRG